MEKLEKFVKDQINSLERREIYCKSDYYKGIYDVLKIVEEEIEYIKGE